MLWIEDEFKKNNISETKLIILYGPSGAGKTFWKDFLDGELKVVEILKILEDFSPLARKEIGSEILSLTSTFYRYFRPFRKVLTMTTRPPREYEEHLVHYRFLTMEEFARERQLGNILEETINFGFHYGSSKEDIERALAKNNAVIVLDNKGVKKIKEVYGDKVVAIYLKVDPVEMEERMTARGEENIQKRLNSLQDENHQEAGLSDYILDAGKRIDRILYNLLKIVFKECKMMEETHVIQRKFPHNASFYQPTSRKNEPPAIAIKKP